MQILKTFLFKILYANIEWFSVQSADWTESQSNANRHAEENHECSFLNLVAELWSYAPAKMCSYQAVDDN